MRSTEGLKTRRPSAPLRGQATELPTGPTVAKYIDTSTCIGCKACEVACQEWNDLPVTLTSHPGTYQTMPTMRANYWNVIQFREQEVNGVFNWLMRKDQCMHCADPGCLAARPSPRA